MSACATQLTTTTEPALPRLSQPQVQAAIALARGATITATADAIGVHRSTLYNWFKNDPLFRTAVTEVRRERYERIKDEMREMDSLALAALRQTLQDPATPAGVRVRAALSVLNRPKDEHGIEEWHMPYMENVDQTLDRRPKLAGPFHFDANRQQSTLPGGIPVPDQPRLDEFRQTSTLGLNFEAPAAPAESASRGEPADPATREEAGVEEYPPQSLRLMDRLDAFRQTSTLEANFQPTAQYMRQAGGPPHHG